MPTITIHTPEIATYVALLADLIQRPDLTITISTDSGLGILIGDPSDRPPARTTTPIDQPAATRAATTHHPVIDAVMDASTKRDANQAQKRWARDHWDDLVSIRCTTCKAKALEACVSPSGKPYGTGFVHQTRIQARQNRKADA